MVLSITRTIKQGEMRQFQEVMGSNLIQSKWLDILL